MVPAAVELTTFAPEVDDHGAYHPTGNLLLALPEIDDGARLASLNIISAAQRGLLEATGDLLTPHVQVDSRETELELTWRRRHHWIPEATAKSPAGSVQITYLPSLGDMVGGDAGFAAQLTYRNTTALPQHVRLRWRGHWAGTALRQFRPTPITAEYTAADDTWTRCRTITAAAGMPVLAIAWRGGPGVMLDPGPGPTWQAERAALVAPGEQLSAEVFIGAGTEPDGAAGTAVHLRRVGWLGLLASAEEWLAARALPVRTLPTPALPGRAAELDARLNLNLFFNYFYAQGDCADATRPVMLTSRSPRYYVSGAFWSRDAYAWSFPAILLTDPARARQVLLASIEAAGTDIAHHALYITGGRLYPGFELDELTAPIIAIGRYLGATGDASILTEAPIRRLREWVPTELRRWRGPAGLYGTFLLPTDDPTDYPYVTTNNATVVVALELLARWDEDPDHAAELAAEAQDLAAALREHCRTEAGWAWAINDAGQRQWREEPPLSLRTLAYWGAADPGDPALTATRRWLTSDYDHHYPGAFPGAGAPHFPAPSGFDLANRMLTGDDSLGDPLAQFTATPMDTGIGCESWNPNTGVVHTGAGMASMAGLLAWTAWANLTGHRYWRDRLAR